MSKPSKFFVVVGFRAFRNSTDLYNVILVVQIRQISWTLEIQNHGNFFDDFDISIALDIEEILIENLKFD